MVKVNTIRNTVFILILFISLFVPIVSAYDYVVIDSKDWRDIYLGIMFSTFDGSKPLFFSSLADVDLKTKLIPKNASVLILESKEKPVIRNYESFLKVRDYSKLNNLFFNDFSDLQVQLYTEIKDKVKNFIVLNPEFGNEAVIAAPLIKDKKYWPVFLTEENRASVVSNFDFDEQSIAAGYFPSRLIDFFPGIRFIDVPYKNMIALLNYTLDKINFDWSALMILDKVDPDILASGKPIFVYDGNLDLLASLVNEKNATKFEVIGGELADVAKELETRSGRDLKLLLKYARTITNLKPYVGKLIDIDAFSVNYPYVSLNVENVTFYLNLNTLALTISNKGNFRAFFYPNLEFMDKAYSIEHPIRILPGQTLTIPFFLNLSKDEITKFDKNKDQAILNILYGMDFPLEDTLKDKDGLPLIQQRVNVSQHRESVSVQLKDQIFDNNKGKLLLKVYNNNSFDVIVFAEIPLDKPREDVISSKKVIIPSHSEGTLVLDTPFLYKDDFYNTTLKISLYFGQKDTLNSKVISVKVVKFYEGSRITGFFAGIIEEPKWLFILIIAIILVIFLVLFRRRRKKKEEQDLNF
ncbi:MAG: hypothetical protein PWP03_756 [Candidatus Woesearchaeota archaeon]|nr:hypothetical protein [Candidatus Woesearchaeota archaeon]MDN5328118.1 hypothetical protein [Candidatus Woesearchaeota archaeon]